MKQKLFMSIFLIIGLVILMPNQVEASQPSIFIEMKDGSKFPDGSDKISVDGEPTSHVSDVKASIKNQYGLVPDSYSLFFNGRELEDTRTLSDYNIQKGNTLQVVMNSIGGGNTTTDDNTENEPSMVVAKPVVAKPVVPKWIPTEDDMYRMSFKGNTIPNYTTSTVNYKFRLENEMQGPKCFDVFDAFRGAYSIGQTYSAYINDELVYKMDEVTTIVLTIPERLIGDNREYEMICVHENGQAIVLEDEDDAVHTITFTTDKCHAFALCYLDNSTD